MTKTQTKYRAQDALMHGMANAILAARESNETEEVIAEMVAQAKKIGERLGYANWPGIW